jgi:hypothetical protein
MLDILVVDGVINVIDQSMYAYVNMMNNQKEEEYEKILNILLQYFEHELKYNIIMNDELYYKFKELRQIIEDGLRR